MNGTAHNVTRRCAFTCALALAAAAGCAPRGKITGTARISNVGSAPVTVTVSGPVVDTARADAAGAYSFDGLPDGAYTIAATAASTAEQTLRADVLVSAAGTTTAPALTFTPVGTVRGKVTLGGAASGNAGISVFVVGSARPAVTDDGGSYVLDDVPAGMQTLHATRLGYEPATADGVAVTWAQEATAPDLTLTPGATGVGALTGKVTLVGQADVSGVTVSLPGTSFTATSDRDGSFAFAGVPTGTYPLSFAKGSYRETIPAVQVLGTGTGLIADASDGALYDLRPIEINQATRLASAGTQPLLSDDGNSVVYTGRDNAVELVPTAGGAAVTLSPNVPPLDGATPPRYQLVPGGPAIVLTADHVLKAVARDGGTSTTLASNVYAFMLAPDAKNVLFFADANLLLSYHVTGTMSIVPVAGGSPTKLASNVLQVDNGFGPLPFAAFSPNGGRVYYLDGDRALASVGLSDGKSTIVFAATLYPQDLPSLIPGSHMGLVVVSGTQIGNSVPRKFTLLDLDTAAVGIDVVTDSDSMSGFVLSADRKDLLYASVRDPAAPFRGLKVVKGFASAAATPKSIAIGINDEQLFQFAFSPDGKTAYYEGRTNADNVIRVEAAPTDGSAPPVTLSSAGSAPGQLAFSPDGTRIVWDESNSDRGVVMTALMTGPFNQVKATQLTDVASSSLFASAQIFSPDGKQLLVATSVVNQIGTLTSFPLAGGPGTRIATGVIVDNASFGFAKDGAHVYYLVPSPLDALDRFGYHTVKPTLYVAPSSGGAGTPLLGRVDVTTLQWASSSTLIVQRAGTPKPYSFQDGLYVATLH